MTTTAKDIAWTRDMLKAELEETAEWRRRKAEEYPDDVAHLFPNLTQAELSAALQVATAVAERKALRPH